MTPQPISALLRPYALSLSMVWRHRQLIGELVLQQLRVKYQRSLLGFLWTLISPALIAAVLITVFSLVIRIRLPDYWAFLISGFFAWHFIQQILASGATVLVDHAFVCRNTPLPPEIPLLSTLVLRLIEFGVAIVLVMAAIAIGRHGTLPASFVMVPLLIVIQSAMAFGLQLPITTLSVFFKDVGHALPILTLALFYMSPVIFPSFMVPEQFQFILALNPLAGVLDLYHTVLYEGVFPTFAELGSTMLIAAITLMVGYAIFERFKHVFAEIL